MANNALLDLTLANDSDEDEPAQGNNNLEESPMRSSSQSGSGESSDDEDDDAIEVDRTAATGTADGTEADPASVGGTPAMATPPSHISNADPDPAVLAYRSEVETRRALYLPPASSARPRTYIFDASVTIPHACHINALALPVCSSHIYSGGSDGFIRRYALHPMLNGSRQLLGFDNNLVTKSALVVQASDSKTPVLVGYWENEGLGEWIAEAESKDESKLRWGTKIAPYGNQSSVYSLAVQSDELWGLSGTSQGTINLWTSRIDEGQIRHVFRSSDVPSLGHDSRSPVSVLTLTGDERTVLSGAWDSRILQCDLDTGVVGRSYLGHTGQISSLAFRPVGGPAPPTPLAPADDEDVSMEDLVTKKEGSKKVEGDVNSPASSTSSSGVAAALVPNPGTPPVPTQIGSSTQPSSPSTKHRPAADEDLVIVPDVKAEMSLDADADGEEDAEGEEEDADGEEDSGNPFAFPGATLDTPPSLSNSALPVGTLPAVPSAAPIVLPPAKKLASRNPALASIPLVGSSQSTLPELSTDVFLSTSIDGQVMLWDRRVKSGEQGGVRRFESGAKGSWCASACWSTSGQEIYVGRRSSLVEVYDIRYSPSTSSSSSSSSPILQTLRMPASSGPVSAITAMTSGKHLLTGSFDNIRLWDLELARSIAGGKKGPMPFKIVPGHHGGVLSSLYVDPLSKFLISASGSRGWDGTSTENVIVHEIKTLY